MTDAETRLHDLLQDAVPGAAVPPDLLSTAACRAAQIRRRRVATRGAIGVATVVATGALVQHRETALDADRIAPLSSHTPSASDPATPHEAGGTVRLLVSGECEPTDAEAGCSRLTLEVRRGGDPQRFVLYDRYGGEQPTALSEPRQLVLTFADGTQRSAPARRVGPREWEFDLDIAAGVTFDTVSLVMVDGRVEVRIMVA